MEQDKDRLSINVAKLYYESDMSQQKIANELGISRPSVSRLLQYAKEHGFVQIRIIDPTERGLSLADELCKKYNLKTVKIANVPLNKNDEIKKAIGLKAAEYLYEIVKDNDIIGIGWGSSLYQMALHLKSKPVKKVQVVQLKGGISYSKLNTYAHEIITLVAKAFSTTGIFLPIPVMFDNTEVKRLVEQDKYVKNILDMGRRANIAVVTVGPASDESILFHLGYYINENDRELLSQKAAGDLCSRFYDDNGKIVDEELNLPAVLHREMLLRLLEGLVDALTDGDVRHDDDEFLPAIVLPELVHRLDIGVRLARARLHLDGELRIRPELVGMRELIRLLHRVQVLAQDGRRERERRIRIADRREQRRLTRLPGIDEIAAALALRLAAEYIDNSARRVLLELLMLELELHRRTLLKVPGDRCPARAGGKSPPH